MYCSMSLLPKGICEITLCGNVPGNRFTRDALLQMHDQLLKAQAMGARALLISHKGDAFCLGGNLGDARAQHAGTVRAFASALCDVLRLLHQINMPTACAIEGDVAGGGLSLVEACDMAVAVESACFSIPEMLGNMAPVVSFMGAYRTFPKKKLMRMALLSHAVSAVEAEQAGLISAVAAPGKSRKCCLDWLNMLLSRNAAAIETVLLMRKRMDAGFFERQLDAASDQLIGLMMHRDTWRMLDKQSPSPAPYEQEASSHDQQA